MPVPAEVARPWLAAYPPGVPSTYRWPEVPLTRLLEDAARDFPALAAVEWHGQTWSWARVDALSSEVAGACHRAGVRPGDRVALALPNGPAAVVVAFATWRLGAVLVLLDSSMPRLVRDASLEATRPRLTVTDDDGPWPTTAGTVVVTTPGDWAAPGRWARVRARSRRGRERSTGHEPQATVGRRPDEPEAAPSVTWSRFVADPPSWSVSTVQPQMPAVLAPTGGTTGHRRIVTLTHRNLVVNAFQARLWVPDVQAGRERVLAATPFTHPFGLTVGLLAGTLAGATLVIPEADDGATLVRAIEQARPTLFPAVPALVERIVDANGRRRPDLSSLRVCLVGGAPLPPELARRYRALVGDGRLREGYGLSEAGPLTHANPVYGQARHGRGGLPVTGTVSIVVDPDDPTRVLPAGRVGLLAVAGPQVMAGYWQEPEATATVLRDGWLVTGDLAVADAVGHVSVVDRLADVIVTAAGVVFPTDVEQVLQAHPAVRAASATALATTDGVDDVLASVVLGPGAVVATDDLVAHCRAHLPTHAVPARIEVVGSLPAAPTGTVVRHRLGRRPPTVDQEVAG